MQYERRSVLRLSGIVATGTAVGLAGCTGDDGSPTDETTEPTESTEGGNGTNDAGRLDQGDLPTYSQWITTDAEGTVFASYLNLESEAAGDGDDPNDELMDDPMYGFAATGALFGSLSLLALSRFGLAGLTGGTGSGTGTGGSSFESTASALVSTQTTVTLLGDMERSELRSALESDEGAMTKSFTETETIGEYTLFTAEPNDGETGTDAIAIGESAVVFAANDTEGQPTVVRDAIDAAAGNAERAVDEHADVDRLLRTAGRGDVVTIAYGDGTSSTPAGGTGGSSEQEYEELQGFDGLISSLSSVEDEATVDGEFAATFSDGDPSELRSVLGSSADESATAVADGMVTATATWDDPN